MGQTSPSRSSLPFLPLRILAIVCINLLCMSECITMDVCVCACACACTCAHMYNVRHDMQMPCTCCLAINHFYLYPSPTIMWGRCMTIVARSFSSSSHCPLFSSAFLPFFSFVLTFPPPSFLYSAPLFA